MFSSSCLPSLCRGGACVPSPDQLGVCALRRPLPARAPWRSHLDSSRRVPICRKVRSSESASGGRPDDRDETTLTSGFNPKARKALRLAMARENALEQYKQEVGAAEPDILKCACLIAQSEYPDLNLGWCVTELNRIADMVEEQLPAQEQRYPLRVLQTINSVLYTQLGFSGNRESYYDADNSYINRVLQRRKGLPITLSLVYMEVARRVGFPMVGVSLPGHFMCRPAVGELEVLVDAFQGGEVCCLEDVQSLLSGLMGLPVRLDPKWMKEVVALPANKFLMRLLNNLKQLYLSDQERLLRIIRYMRVTDPSAPLEVRDEGLVLYALERHSEASVLLAQYLQMAPAASDAAKINDLLGTITYILSLNQPSSHPAAEDEPEP